MPINIGAHAKFTGGTELAPFLVDGERLGLPNLQNGEVICEKKY